MWSSRVFYCLALWHLVASQLQPVVQSDKKNQYILQAIAFVERLDAIRNFILFLGDCRSSTCDLLPRKTADSFAMPVTVIGNELVSLEGIITRSTVMVIIFSNFNDRIKQVIDKDFYIHHAPFIFVQESEKDLPLNDSERVQLFDWCRRKGMRKILLIETYQKERYRCWTPHPSATFLKIKLLTDWELKYLDQKLLFEIHKQYKFHLLVSVYDSYPMVYVVSMKSIILLISK